MKETLDKNFHGFRLVQVVENPPGNNTDFVNNTEVYSAESPFYEHVATFHGTHLKPSYPRAKAWIEASVVPQTRTALTLKQSMVLELIKADLTNADVNPQDIFKYGNIADAILSLK